MLVLDCPYCGLRPEIEFRCGGEAHIARPPEPAEVGDAAWADYLFYRTSPKGVHAERWLHAHGCRRWFNALRDTVSDRVLATYAMGEPRPIMSLSARLREERPGEVQPDASARAFDADFSSFSTPEEGWREGASTPKPSPPGRGESQ